MRRLIHVGQDEDISDLAGRLQTAAEGDEAALVMPAGSQGLQTQLHLRLLGQISAKRGIRVVLVTPDRRLQELAIGAGVPAYASSAALERGTPVAAPPGAGAIAPSAAGRPPAPTPPAAAPRGPLGPAAARPIPGSPPGSGGGPGAPPADPTGADFAFGAGPRPGSPRDGLGEGLATATPSSPAVGRANGGWPDPRDLVAPARPGAARVAPRWGEPEVSAPGGGAGGATFRPLGAAGGAPVQATRGLGTVVAPPAPPPGRGGPPPGPGRGARHPGTTPTPKRLTGPQRWRSPLIFGAIGAAVLILVLLLVLTPSATVTITITEQPLSYTATIQGSTTPVAGAPCCTVTTQVVKDTAQQTFTATPSGTQTLPAATASGSVVLTSVNNKGATCYGGCSAFTLSQGTEFQTSGASPALFQVTQDTIVTVPAYPAPSNPIPVAAVTAGSAGNVPAGSISVWVCGASNSTCQVDAGQLQVSNAQATSGGADAQQQTVASANDIQSWTSQVSQIEQALEATGKQALTAKASPGTIPQDPNGDGWSFAFTVTPDVTQQSTTAAMSTTTVTVAMTAQATVYNPSDVAKGIIAQLKKSLPAATELASSTPRLSNQDVIQAAADGTFTMSVTGTAFYRPIAFNTETLRKQMAGHNPGDVPGIVEQQVPNSNATVSETPFGLFYMPFFSSHITIVVKYVTASSSGG
jgi:hypothetical protein